MYKFKYNTVPYNIEVGVQFFQSIHTTFDIIGIFFNNVKKALQINEVASVAAVFEVAF